MATSKLSSTSIRSLYIGFAQKVLFRAMYQVFTMSPSKEKLVAGFDFPHNLAVFSQIKLYVHSKNAGLF